MTVVTIETAIESEPPAQKKMFGFTAQVALSPYVGHRETENIMTAIHVFFLWGVGETRSFAYEAYRRDGE